MHTSGTVAGTIVVCFGSTTPPSGGNIWSRQTNVAVAEAINQHLQDKKIADKNR